MTDAATANRLAREAHARDMAERRARLSGVTEAPAGPGNAPYVDPGASRSPSDDPDSAEGVLAFARSVGLPGLKARAPAEPAAKEESASKKEDKDSAADVLDLARQAGIPGLRKR